MKPKYSLYKNFFYAIDGAKELLKESAFKIELVCFIIAFFLLLILPYPLWAKIFMFGALFLPLFAEAINSAIENVVDLLMPEYHEHAKHAKDIAAFGVVISIFMTITIWFGFIVFFWSKY